MNFVEQQELREFESFLLATNAEVSPATTKLIFSQHKKLNYLFIGGVFVKLLSIHAIVSFLSLAVCHQFGMNPFNSTVSLSDYFMHFGHSACMLFCGFLFVGSSVFMARLLLNHHEFSIIKNLFALQIFVLCSLSLGVFMAFGAHMSLAIALLWALGAYMSSALVSYIPNMLKTAL